jgi:WXG100 family type VII secretion target
VGGYAVDPAELDHGAAALATAAAGARAALEPLRASAAGLLSARWQGAAAGAFRCGWEEWLEGVVAMLGALDDLATALRASGAGYATTDQAVRASAAGFRP